MKVYGIGAKSVFPSPYQIWWGFYFSLLQPRTQGCLSLQLPEGLSSLEKQTTASHPATSCLLLRLGPGQIQWRGEGSLPLHSSESGMEALPWEQLTDNIGALIALPCLMFPR